MPALSSRPRLRMAAAVCSLVAFVTGLATGCRNAPKRPATLAERPNIVFVVVDDLGYRDLGFMGSSVYETPNVDRLAAGGVRFDLGYAGCQVCSPSRATLMTGRFAARHGITDYIGAATGERWRKQNRHTKLLPPTYVDALPADLTVLPEALRQGGYRTFFAGKWHLGDVGSSPEDHGFEHNVGGWRAGGPDGGFFDPYKNPRLPNRQPGENLSMRLARETVDFIARHENSGADEPFFAMLSFYAVHSPIQTTEAKWRKYRDKIAAQGVADQGFAMERRLPIRLHQDNPVYAGLVEAMDDAVGVVLDALREHGLEDETIVVFTSDNGGVASGDAFSTANSLRGGKGYQWEGGIRVPFVIRVPGGRKGARVESTRVTGADLYPTLLDLAGLPLRTADHLDGVSLAPLLEGRRLRNPDRPLFWHYPHYGNQGGDPSSIVIEGDWKLIHYWEDGTRELYDLSSDPLEQRDVAAEHRDRVESMAGRLMAFLDENDAKRPLQDPEYDAQGEADLQAWRETELLERKEQERMRMLDPEWRPNKTWWGSAPEGVEGAAEGADGG